MPALPFVLALAAPAGLALPARPHITLPLMFWDSVAPVKMIMLCLMGAMVATVIICATKLLRSRPHDRSAFIANMRYGGLIAGLTGTAYGLINTMIGIAESGNAHFVSVAPGVAEGMLSLFLGLSAGVVAIMAHTLLTARIDRAQLAS